MLEDYLILLRIHWQVATYWVPVLLVALTSHICSMSPWGDVSSVYAVLEWHHLNFSSICVSNMQRMIKSNTIYAFLPINWRNFRRVRVSVSPHQWADPHHCHNFISELRSCINFCSVFIVDSPIKIHVNISLLAHLEYVLYIYRYTNILLLLFKLNSGGLRLKSR